VEPDIVVTGVGVASAIGLGQEAFIRALLEGAHAFRIMERPGRQRDSAFLGAELPPLAAEADPPPVPRTASFSSQVALSTLREAWNDARLAELDPARIGLIVGGSNFQQRELSLTHERYFERPAFVRPTYAMSFMDTDLSALCTADFAIRGMAHTVGGASASGQLAIIQALEAIAGGQVDACIALGALMDLSHWELQAFRSLGAMGSDRFADQPAAACRPFDRAHDGFIFGECCGAVVLERRTRSREHIRPYGRMTGWGTAFDGNRNPDPSLEGESTAIRRAMHKAGYSPSTIDYINLHGTGSVRGDQVELDAICSCGLTDAYLNATKSLTGHGLTAAGTVEVVATLLQLRCGRLHPTRNLEAPLEPALNWVREQPVEHSISRALTLSFGFGGIYTALCIEGFREENYQ
jgi:malonyl-ACP decarboxylase